MILPLTELSSLLGPSRTSATADADAGRLPPWMLRAYLRADEKAEMDREVFRQLYPERFPAAQPAQRAATAPARSGKTL